MILEKDILKLIGFISLIFFISPVDNCVAATQNGLLEKTIIKTSFNGEKHKIIELEIIEEISAVLETSVKLAETNFRSSENFKTTKQIFSVKLALQVVRISKATFYTYSSRRDKSENKFPIYISNRRLII